MWHRPFYLAFKNCPPVIVMTQCLIAVGCNQGECRNTIRQAAQKIDDLPETRWVSSSRLVESQPVGAFDGSFLNGVFRVDTELGPHQLLEHLLQIEQEAGRDRSGTSNNRPLDLDLLLFGQEIIQTPELTVPHPRMTFRRFVMEPAAELVPEMMHPALGAPLGQLWEQLQIRSNLIAILVPSSFPIDDVSEQSTSDILWVVPNSPAVSTENLLQKTPDSHAWVVVLSAQAEQLTPLQDQIKLQIYMASENHAFIEKRNPFSGPTWEIPFSQLNELSLQVEAAIQSMIA